MNCPFCAEEIKDEAFVCKHCRRDLSIPRPLLLQLGAQSEQITALAASLDELKTQVASLVENKIVEPPKPDPPDEQPRPRISSIVICLAAAYLLLVSAHYIFTWRDLDLEWLLAATIFLPGLPAVSTATFTRLRFSILIALAVGVGILSVATMDVMVGSKLSVAWPHSRSEWVANILWTLSVTLSFLTGALTRRALVGGHGVRAVAWVWGLFTQQRMTNLTDTMARIGRLIEVATPILTAIGAVWAGVRSVLRASFP